MGVAAAVRALLSAYDAVIVALAIVAALVLAAIFGLIVVDVSLRAFGFQPPVVTSALTEYGLLYFTMGAAPYLLRTRAHVFVESLRDAMPERARRGMEIAVYLSGAAISLTIAILAGWLVLRFAGSGENDVRSIMIPRWFLFAPICAGFVLLFCEFLRFLFGPESMYDRDRAKGDAV